MQPSASRTALLLACPRPFDPALEETPDLPGEPARYGTAFHSVIAECLRSPAKKPLEKTAKYAKEIDRAAKENDVKAAAAELAGHVKSSVKVLRNWLEREKLEVEEVETAYAVRASATGGCRSHRIKPHDENHRYAVEEGELPGTVDLIAMSANRKRVVVVDHKTGSGSTDVFARPSTIPQMRTLGLVTPPLAFTTTEREVGIFHADRLGLPALYSEPYETSDQHAHARQINRALELVGSGFLRSGPECTHCPARVGCPAHTADILAEGSAALVRSANAIAVEPITGALVPASAADLAVEERAGLLYDLLKKFRALEKAGSEEIRRLVREGKIIETRDGGVLTLKAQTYETLSKKSVIEALGKIEGEKMLEKLRQKGAMRETKREMLVPEK